MFKGICGKKLFRMALAASFSAAMSYIIILTDTILVGQLLNERAMGSIGLVSPLNSLAVFISTLISGGVSSCIISQIASFNSSTVRKYFTDGVLLAIAAGLVLFAVTILLGDMYIGSAGKNTITYIYGRKYLRFYSLVLLFMPAFNLLHNIMFVRGKVKMYVLIHFLQLFGNIGLSIILSKYLGMEGISLGTALSTLLCLVIMIRSLRKENIAPERHFYTETSLIKGIAENGILAASPILYTSLFTFFFNRVFIESFGEELLPVLTVSNNLQAVLTLFGGIGLAATPLVAMYDAEYNTKQLRRVIEFAVKLTTLIGIFFALLALLFSRSLVALFGVTDSNLSQIARLPFMLIPLGFIGSGYCLLIFTYHSTVGPINYASYVSVMQFLLAPTVTVLPLMNIFGSTGVWVGFMLAPFVAAALAIAPIHYRYGSLASPFLLCREAPPKVYFFEIAELGQNAIIETSQRADRVLGENGVCAATRNYVGLLIEEVLMLSLEKNAGQALSAECTLSISDEVMLVIKDSGEPFDVTDEDMPVSSLRAFTVSRIIAKQNNKLNLAVLCCNRNAFTFPIK